MSLYYFKPLSDPTTVCIKAELHRVAHKAFHDGTPLPWVPCISLFHTHLESQGCTCGFQNMLRSQGCLVEYLIEYLTPNSHSMHAYWIQESKFKRVPRAYSVDVWNSRLCRDKKFKWKRSCIKKLQNKAGIHEITEIYYPGIHILTRAVQQKDNVSQVDHLKLSSSHIKKVKRIR